MHAVDGEHSDTGILVQRSRLGEPAAFEALVDRSALRLLLFLRRNGGRALRADADEEDLLQIVVERAWTRLSEFEVRGAGTFHAWLVAMARTAISGSARRRRGGRSSMGGPQQPASSREARRLRTSTAPFRNFQTTNARSSNGTYSKRSRSGLSRPTSACQRQRRGIGCRRPSRTSMDCSRGNPEPPFRARGGNRAGCRIDPGRNRTIIR